MINHVLEIAQRLKALSALNMTFAEAKAEADRLWKLSESTGKRLEAFPRGAMGLTPDNVKSTPEYKRAKAEFDKAFAQLRAFNQVYVKQFKKELLEDRRNRYNTKAWTDNVDTSWSPPEGFFKQSPDKIARGLKAAHPDQKSAMSALTFYINRAGKNLDPAAKQRLHMAQDSLKHIYEE